MKREIVLTINESVYRVEVEVRRTLLEVIRETIGLKGTKEMCNKGDCGACTVIMDGRPVLSCLVLAVEADGSQIQTIEGLSDGYNLHPLQNSFVEKGATQCGFCTPGMIMTAKALLERTPNPTEEQIKEGIANNICRCTGYITIIDAIQDAANKVGGQP